MSTIVGGWIAHQLAGEQLVRLHQGDPEQYPVERILGQVEVLAGSLLPR